VPDIRSLGCVRSLSQIADLSQSPEREMNLSADRYQISPGEREFPDHD
jgi:hypothetical protein